MQYDVYVSKDISLPDNFMPNDLVEAESKYKDGIKVDSVAYQNWLKLKKDADSQNYAIDIESAYRSYDYQKKIMEELIDLKGEEYASNAVAEPGHSEHQTGLAIDFCVLRNGVYLNSDDHVDIMYTLDECKYIAGIAHEYGFIIRYPAGKEEITGYKYEPWHLRYVGKEIASYIHETGLTFDEYFKQKQLIK